MKIAAMNIKTIQNLALLFVLSCFQGCLPQDDNFLETKLREFKIVPDFFPYAPKKTLKVIFPHGELTPGDELKFEQFNDTIPILKWEPESDRTFYTLFVQGIVYWSWGASLETEAWFIYDIPGNRYDQGTVVYKWNQPEYGKRVRPKNGTIDRYTFWLFKQHTFLNIERMKDYHQLKYKHQDYWQLANYARDYKLTAVEANFFWVNNTWE
ncbi:uncharacterized protein LOC135833242 isoform X1 [Planococcus citri]|uniref:uncharacterized protein LOC135833242 isoform X1 n=1 Tax=Planococcus citri TaxID=170843 RepID=UPI0031F74FE0